MIKCGAKPKVLVIDDAVAVREAIYHVLRKNYRIYGASSADGGLEIFRKLPP